MLAAWFYTGGPRPYGYAGLGEVFVFVFFGLVAVCGTTYVQAGRVTGAVGRGRGRGRAAWPARSSWPTTCATSRPTRVAGKRTLAVRLGDAGTRRLYAALVALPVAGPGAARGGRHPWALLALLARPAAVAPVRTVPRRGRRARPGPGAARHRAAGASVRRPARRRARAALSRSAAPRPAAGPGPARCAAWPARRPRACASSAASSASVRLAHPPAHARRRGRSPARDIASRCRLSSTKLSSPETSTATSSSSSPRMPSQRQDGRGRRRTARTVNGGVDDDGAGTATPAIVPHRAIGNRRSGRGRTVTARRPALDPADRRMAETPCC